MNNIYLVGMPGCGKTTIGNIVCQKIGIELLDLDQHIVDRESKSISELFEKGESHFREAETNALRAVTAKEGIVVATGGGVVVKDENIEIMKKDGKVIFIDASPDFIIGNSSLEGRPLLKDKAKIYELYNSRIAKYRKSADYTVVNNGMLSAVSAKTEEVIRLILSKYKAR